MKKTLFFLAVILSMYSVDLIAQRVLYSRNTAVVNHPDAIQLVANVSNHHHLLSFTAKENPLVHIYDQQLQLVSRKQIAYLLPADCELSIIPFDNYYYLYVHVARTKSNELWKIDGQGTITLMTGLLHQLKLSQFQKHSSIFKFTAIKNRLYVMSHTYFKELGKINTTIVHVDSMLKPVLTENAFYTFAEGDQLRQVTLTSPRDLLVLKTSRKDEDYTLELQRVNTQSDFVITKTFTSAGSGYLDPTILFNSTHSEMVIYSRMLSASLRGVRATFMCHLDDSLKEIKPLSLLKQPFNNSTAFFIWINNQYPWIAFFSFRNNALTRTIRNKNFQDSDDILRDLIYNQDRQAYFIPYADQFYDTRDIHFAQLDGHLKISHDSIITNNRTNQFLDPFNFCPFLLKGKSYLLLSQHTRKRNGLVLVHSNDKKQFPMRRSSCL